MHALSVRAVDVASVVSDGIQFRILPRGFLGVKSADSDFVDCHPDQINRSPMHSWRFRTPSAVTAAFFTAPPILFSVNALALLEEDDDELLFEKIKADRKSKSRRKRAYVVIK